MRVAWGTTSCGRRRAPRRACTGWPARAAQSTPGGEVRETRAVSDPGPAPRAGPPRTVCWTHVAMVAIVPAMAHDPERPEALLPLPAATFHILLALADEERHGYAILLDVEGRTGGELRLSAGTLYRSIARMVEQGLISEVARRRITDDERRRYYRLTAFGTAVARAEMRRLAQLVRLARARGLTPGPEPA